MIIVLRRKRLGILLVTIMLIITTIVISGSGVVGTLAESNRKLPVYAVDRNDNKIAISFDAAWGADKTRQIVDILVKYDVKATFFLVGFWIDKYKDEVKYIHDNGMEIGNHSLNHLKMSTIDKATINKEITGVNTKIKDIIGIEPKVFRPPFGDYNNALIESVNELGMMPIQWDVDSLDWKGLSSGQLSKRIFDRVKSGSIILCHNNSDHIVEALPMIILNLKNKGYEFVTMSELVYHDNYKIDNNGVQHLKNQEEQ